MTDKRTRAELAADLREAETKIRQLQADHEEALRLVQEEVVAYINRAKDLAFHWQADAAWERRRATDFWTNRSIALVIFHGFVIVWHLGELTRAYSAATGYLPGFYVGDPTINITDGTNPLFRTTPTHSTNTTTTPIPIPTCTTRICPGDLSFLQFRGPTDAEACFRVFNTTSEESWLHAASISRPMPPGPKLLSAKAKPEYHRLQKKYHPDKAGRCGLSKEEAKLIQQILQECWELIDEGFVDPTLSNVEWEGWLKQQGEAVP